MGLFFEWDWSLAKRELQRALELNPNYATAHHAYSIVLAITGRLPEAIVEAERALAIDPLSIPVNNIVGEMYMFAGQWNFAIGQYRRTIEMDPNVPLPHENLALSLEEVGNPAEALEEYLKARTLSGESLNEVTELREAYRLSGLLGYWRKTTRARSRAMERLARRNNIGSPLTTPDWERWTKRSTGLEELMRLALEDDLDKDVSLFQDSLLRRSLSKHCAPSRAAFVTSRGGKVPVPVSRRSLNQLCT